MSSLVNAFHPNVTFETQTFSLADDLDCLDRLRGQRAPVAVVLYAARVLEGLIDGGSRRAGLVERGPNGEEPKLYQMVRTLLNHGRIAKETYWLLDRLRELGNKARHLKQKITPDDADQAYAIALRAVHWYFRELPGGPELPALTAHNQPFDSLLPAGPAGLLQLIASEGIGREGFIGQLRLNDRDCPLLVSPVLAAVMVEKLLDRNRPDEAQEVLSAALGRMPDDVRLRQLQGLLWSRTGRLEEAIGLLESIGRTDSAADEETAGILAGAYKRRAAADPDRYGEWLRRCQEGYAAGWQRSQGTNPYLGINSAATALWLGLPGYEATAREVRDLLTGRKQALSPRPLAMWDGLALAEAHLLLQDWDAARACYREAARRHADDRGSLDVARGQADKDLRALGRADLAGTMLPE